MTECMNRIAHTLLYVCLVCIVNSRLSSPSLQFKMIAHLCWHPEIEKKACDHPGTQKYVQEDRQQPREPSGARARGELRNPEQLLQCWYMR